jgi:hypothetical protein
MNWYPHACPVCAGALHDNPRDKGRAECIMCGRTYAIVNLLPLDGSRKGPIKIRPLEPASRSRRGLRAMLP